MQSKTWSIENCRALRVAELKYHRKIYESLIYTHSVKNTRGSLGYYVNEFNFKYRVLNRENSSPYVQIILNKSSDIVNINKLLNTCGWYIAHAINKLDEQYNIKEISELFKLKNLNYLLYTAKFIIELERKLWPDYLYHISPLKNKDNKSLIKSKERCGFDQICLYNINDENESVKKLIFDLQTRDKFANRYILSRIFIKIAPDYFRLFYDPDLINNYFTLNTVSCGSYSRKIIDVNLMDET